MTAASRSAATTWTLPEPPSSETRERLLAAAERLFAARGYAGVSVRAIAAEAGVNWSLVGYYFRGKHGLLAEVYRRHCTTLNDERLRLAAFRAAAVGAASPPRTGRSRRSRSRS